MNSGITVQPDTSQQWNRLRADPTVSFVKITINDKDTFEIVSQGSTSSEDSIVQAARELKAKEPAYLLIREGSKFYIVFYCPMNARVHDKMVYSSSLNSLKLGLGSDNLIAELYVNTPEECTREELTKSSHPTDRLEVMTGDERCKYETHMESAGSMDTQAKVAVDLPVKVHADAATALKGFSSSSVSGVLLQLNADTEELEVATQGDYDLTALSGMLAADAPRFVLCRQPYEHPETGAQASAVVFVYYCPDKARPKMRMFYSAAKSIVVKILEAHGITRDCNFEASDASEVSVAEALDALFPKKHERVVVAKPKPKARGGKSLGVKFSDF
jgi:hypothetical protein